MKQPEETFADFKQQHGDEILGGIRRCIADNNETEEHCVSRIRNGYKAILREFDSEESGGEEYA